ncbi:SPOR domain-containing protein [Mangrovicoccus sp. HB161399]|uniref:SPOR domain-containing protein n=1 Tax=Mangrovicoccus sp. HB161399 TaxID=2720392 RepID=UPI0015555D9D|nr:SPOR domain-containing protein [Mangrovicoccus sp. HB161399]
MSGAARLAAALAVALAQAAAAQPGADAPQGAGGSFLDGKGCAWQKVEIGSRVLWAALIGPGGSQLCDPDKAAPAAVLPGPEALPPAGGDAQTEAAGDGTAPAAMAMGAPGPDMAAGSAEAGPAAAPAKAKAHAVRQPSRVRSPQFPEPGLYIQVAAFREMPNAERTVRWLQGLGLPALRQDFPRRQGALRLIYAGPFADAAAADAGMAAIRGLGFRDAFVWDRR